MAVSVHDLELPEVELIEQARSAGLRCARIGRRTCASGPGPSFAPQPAQVDSVVSRISSRVNTKRCYLRNAVGSCDEETVSSP